jgi:hypothetical protein
MALSNLAGRAGSDGRRRLSCVQIADELPRAGDRFGCSVGSILGGAKDHAQYLPFILIRHNFSALAGVFGICSFLERTCVLVAALQPEAERKPEAGRD